MSRWKQFLTSDDGPTMVEYALLLGLLVLVSVTTMGGFGTGMRNIYNIISSAMP